MNTMSVDLDYLCKKYSKLVLEEDSLGKSIFWENDNNRFTVIPFHDGRFYCETFDKNTLHYTEKILTAKELVYLIES